jgi:UDP-3-O-acyl N-acetylglucosamine deacetylase
MKIIRGNASQHTLAREAVYKGIGLHTGSKCSLTFKPAPTDQGVVFSRVDLRGHPLIPADYRHVTAVVRGTTLSANGDKDAEARIHTVEHVLSALSCLGIDNAFVEVNASEPPVADGSAAPFIDVLQKAGTVSQEAPRTWFQPDPFEYKAGDTGTTYTVEPSEEYVLDVTVDYPHPLIGRQQRTITVTKETFIQDISRARTFCFDYEVEALKRQGLAKGGSLDNAVVVGADRIHNKEKSLRYPDEFVRHKILDLIGDLSLLGLPLKARVTASRVGHGYNVNLVKHLAAQLEPLRASSPA